MRQKMRVSLRLAAALLVLSVPAATLFGAAESEAAADERLAISLIPFTPRGTTLGPDTWTELYIEERYGVNLEPWYDIDAYDTSAIQVRLATGDLPNMGACQGSLGECVDTGMVREVPREMIMEHMPNWMRWQEHYAGDQKWERTTVDGVNYAIPTALSMASTGQVMGFRADWMRAVGYEPEPVPDREFFRGPDSIAEIEELLLKFRNADPDGDGRKDSYGYMVWKNSVDFQRTVLPNVFGSFGIQLHVWDVRDGAGYYSLVDPNYRDALIYVNTWWEQEIIHPDTPIAVRADVVRAMANDEFGAWSELDAWQSQYGAGPWGALREVHPDADIAYSITPVGRTGGRGTWYRNPNWGPISIGANTSDEVLIKIMQILEDQFSDAELYARVFYGGEQGETWQIDENGYHVAIPGTGAAKDGASGALLGVRMISPAHIVPPVDKVYIAPNRHALQSWIEANQTSGPGIGFRPDWNEDERALAGNLKTIEQEFAWKGITGAIDIAASWDGYVEDMMNAGLEQLLESLANKGM